MIFSRDASFSGLPMLSLLLKSKKLADACNLSIGLNEVDFYTSTSFVNFCNQEFELVEEFIIN
jgi:hypothetical protein